MIHIKNTVLVFAAASLLSACSYFDTGEEADLAKAKPAETVNLTQTPPDEMQTQLAPVEFNDVADVIEQSSDGRVQVFPLDGPSDSGYRSMPSDGFPSDGVVVEPVSALPVNNGGSYAELNTFPGVEIYPLDDAMAQLVNPYVVTSSGAPTPITPFTDEVTSMPLDNGPAKSAPQNVVYFDRSATTLSPDNLAQVTNLARNYSGSNVFVIGHASVESGITDPIQRKIANLKVSMDRALSVAKALIEGGVPPERIETKGFGEVMPPPVGDLPIEVASRRVEILGISVQ